MKIIAHMGMTDTYGVAYNDKLPWYLLKNINQAEYNNFKLMEFTRCNYDISRKLSVLGFSTYRELIKYKLIDDYRSYPYREKTEPLLVLTNKKNYYETEYTYLNGTRDIYFLNKDEIKNTLINPKYYLFNKITRKVDEVIIGGGPSTYREFFDLIDEFNVNIISSPYKTNNLKSTVFVDDIYDKLKSEFISTKHKEDYINKILDVKIEFLRFYRKEL